MKTYICQVCSHVAFDEAPVDCPVCGSAIENFENVANALKKPLKPDNPDALEKEHLPQVSLKGQCLLMPGDDCTDVNVKIGITDHVMETEHCITFIDIYLNKRYAARALLTPKATFPAAGFHANRPAGSLSVIAHCSVHGYWITTVQLEKE